jgi:hypothetical protein
VKSFEIAYFSYTEPLGTSEKKTATADNLLQKGQDKMNSPHTKQHICKPLKPTQNQSLQKSCFLADTPVDICIFVGNN